ncbi:MAG: HNH endonuclease [Rhodoferax sp.]|nr:HNH endonuclease [Rhodoferax sp.]MDP3651676.1 HNH endonuclease [Rhodoferax sp.]
MAVLSEVTRWVPETDGERLFMAAYEMAAPCVPVLFGGQAWVVSPEGMTEACRLSAAMEITHRCLNEGVDLYTANPQASVDPMVHRLRLVIGMYQMNEVALRVAQVTRLASLAYINRQLSPSRIKQVHQTERKFCCWCGNPTLRSKNAPENAKATVEHLWPEFLGGNSALENLAIACSKCNTARQHAFTWAWFSTPAINEKLDVNGAVPREVELAIALHRLIKVASGQSPLSTVRTTLKAAMRLLNGAIPNLNLPANRRFTYFEILQNSTE